MDQIYVSSYDADYETDRFSSYSIDKISRFSQ